MSEETTPWSMKRSGRNASAASRRCPQRRRRRSEVGTGGKPEPEAGPVPEPEAGPVPARGSHLLVLVRPRPLTSSWLCRVSPGIVGAVDDAGAVDDVGAFGGSVMGRYGLARGAERAVEAPPVVCRVGTVGRPSRTRRTPQFRALGAEHRSGRSAALCKRAGGRARRDTAESGDESGWTDGPDMSAEAGPEIGAEAGSRP